MKSFFNFLSKNKLYTAINLFGLAVSLMFVILIADYSKGLLGVDRFHENRDRIYLIGSENGFSSNHYSTLLLQDQFPEIDKICGIASLEYMAFENEDNQMNAHVLYADSTFFDLFSFPVISGDISTSLSSREKAVATETFAQKMFGTKDAVGKTINLIGKERVSLVISAVIKDFARTALPVNTELIIPYQNTKLLETNDYYSPGVIMHGGGQSNKTFIMAKQGADLTAKIPDILKFMEGNTMEYKLADSKEVILVPLPKVMLDPHNKFDGLEHGNRQMLLILLSAGIAILIFAITNYINLTVAQTGFRAKEMACRKLLGDTKKGITRRMIGESTLITTVAFAVGFILAVIFQNYASSLCQERIDVVSGLTPQMIVIYAVFIAFLGVVSGLIPAYTLSKYKPIDIVKGTLRYRSKMVFSKIFLIFQNVITIVLLVSSMTIYLQIKHLISAPLGHNIEGIIEGVDWEMSDSELDAFKSELLQMANVEEVGVGQNSAFVMRMSSRQSFTDKDGNDRWIVMMKLDSCAIDIFGLELLTDHRAVSDAIYLNEAAATALGIGLDDTEFSINYGDGEQRKILGGIFRNFRLGTVLEEYAPIVINPITSSTQSDSYTPGKIIYIKVSGDERDAMESIVKAYVSVTSREPDGIFRIADENIAATFSKERSTVRIVFIFTMIAMIISALGLFAMSTYFTRQRIKEIGVRKIFGGTRSEILNMQLWSFIRPLLISLVLAIPLAYYIMDKWLQNYSYRIQVYPWLFVLAGLFIITIGILTVLGESMKAVNENPINAIRAE